MFQRYYGISASFCIKFSKKRIAAVPIAGVAISTSPRNRALAATSVFAVCFINILKAAK